MDIAIKLFGLTISAAMTVKFTIEFVFHFSLKPGAYYP